MFLKQDRVDQRHNIPMELLILLHGVIMKIKWQNSITLGYFIEIFFLKKQVLSSGN